MAGRSSLVGNVEGTPEAIILGVESSCDETACGVIAVSNGKVQVLSNVVSSQEIHSIYGGVVPEIASREHIRRIYPVAERALTRANLALHDIDAIAWTKGPGLIGALLVGALFAKGVAVAARKPQLAVSHLWGHLLTAFLAEPPATTPYLCLLASGGHTILCLVENPYRIRVLGESLDDAAGEAFDKCAVMLGLGYPGGPQIDRLSRGGDPTYFSLPLPQPRGLNFSFSGLKTAFKQIVEKGRKQDPNFVERHLTDLAASIQKAIVDHLLDRLEGAYRQTGIRNIAIVGGVAANSYFRASLQSLAMRYDWSVHAPPLAYCTDNAVMIALGGYYKLKAGLTASPDEIPTPRYPLPNI